MTNCKWLIVCLLFITFSLLLGQSAQAVGVGVKPKEINLPVKVGRETVTEFLVINVAQEPAIYQIYPDALEDEIKIEPTDFQLESGGNQLVKAKIIIKTPGRFSTNISVVARPLGVGGLATASGVKIPVTITASGIPLWWLILGLMIACLLIIFTVLLIKKKGKSPVRDR